MIVSAIARPPIPAFVVAVQQDGLARFLGIGFAVLDNSTKFIHTATFQAFHRNDAAAEATTLSVGVDAITTSWTVADGSALTAGELYAIGGEVVTVDTINGNAISVTRAQKGSTAAAHSATAKLWKITRGDFAYTFPFNAFSGLAGSVGGAWEGAAELGSRRIVPVDCFVTNRKGDSPTVTNNYTSGFQNNGLGVFNGGQYARFRRAGICSGRHAGVDRHYAGGQYVSGRESGGKCEVLRASPAC